MNEKFFSLPIEKQEAIINAGYRVFSENSYKKSPMSEIADAAETASLYYSIIFIIKKSCICSCGRIVRSSRLKN